MHPMVGRQVGFLPQRLVETTIGASAEEGEVVYGKENEKATTKKMRIGVLAIAWLVGVTLVRMVGAQLGGSGCVGECRLLETRRPNRPCRPTEVGVLRRIDQARRQSPVTDAPTPWSRPAGSDDEAAATQPLES